MLHTKRREKVGQVAGEGENKKIKHPDAERREEIERGRTQGWSYTTPPTPGRPSSPVHRGNKRSLTLISSKSAWPSAWTQQASAWPRPWWLYTDQRSTNNRQPSKRGVNRRGETTTDDDVP